MVVDSAYYYFLSHYAVFCRSQSIVSVDSFLINYCRILNIFVRIFKIIYKL
jgi:hypothetical protein